jgi:hypothetical protein
MPRCVIVFDKSPVKLHVVPREPIIKLLPSYSPLKIIKHWYLSRSEKKTYSVVMINNIWSEKAPFIDADERKQDITHVRYCNVSPRSRYIIIMQDYTQPKLESKLWSRGTLYMAVWMGFARRGPRTSARASRNPGFPISCTNYFKGNKMYPLLSQ